ncbi:uncharacterized protein K489DRAFT_125754 [Dissoconium aciculare CBS 342.82]|uniref:Orc1-like AAA ATPase domain-containing protein n=1 Tax=Dissoconium aciculare CBS 342.82 TaxID=1314786 RepID=A0A6J3MGJ8_9PEZI|nr:uncharacterized protein K489DRAFT_125754 [Dissoconium aciculare CBS 342.82]KAF1826804.1 hypothetical protein K489DRAFT_125754 [Dissoconium aciculare CBS 342.82]
MGQLTAFFRSTAPSQRRRIFVVHGMGGTGKTQLCAEFVRTQREWFTAVFWLDGSSKNALRQSMSAAALRLLDGQVSPAVGGDPAELTRLSDSFLQWLSRAGNENWLIVIDNVDREWQSVVQDDQAYNYHEFLPSADHGNTIITTRLARLQRPGASLALGSVDDGLARKMIESRAGRPVDDIEALLLKLGGLPLALVQAGSYLNMTGITVAAYIREYDETWADLMQRQDQFPLQEYAERSVLTTWKMSYTQVQNVDALAARLLDQWAFLHHSDVWPELLSSRSDDPSAVSLDHPIDDAFSRMTEASLRHAIGSLKHYSLLSVGAEDARHFIHPVLHTWCLHNIESAEARQELLGRALQVVVSFAKGMPTSATKDERLRLVSHARTVGRRVGTWTMSESRAEDCHSIASFLDEWEASDVVRDLYLRALRGKEKAYGAEHTSTLNTVNNLGLLYSQGKMAEAEEMYLRALRGYEKLSWVSPARVASVKEALSSLRQRLHYLHNEQASESITQVEDNAMPSVTSLSRGVAESPKAFSRLMRKMWKRSQLK